MSRFGSEYPLTPSRSRWRSAFTGTLTVGMIVAVSAISGAVVTLDLLGSASKSEEGPAVVATWAPVRTAPAVTPIFARPVSLPALAPTTAAAAVAQPAATASVPLAVQPATPAPSVASVDEPAAAPPDSQLTFTNGYARRRAMQAAATAAASSGAKIDVARVESETQMGRSAKAKPRTVARQQDQRHVTDARGENGPFARFDTPSAHRLAYGDQRDPRAYRRPQQGGFFGGMF